MTTAYSVTGVAIYRMLDLTDHSVPDRGSGPCSERSSVVAAFIKDTQSEQNQRRGFVDVVADFGPGNVGNYAVVDRLM